MGSSKHRYYWDIYFSLLLSTLFLLVFFIFPGLKLVRVVLGIPFLFFAPGYMITTMLFPPVLEIEDQDGERSSPNKTKRSGFKAEKKVEKAKEEEIVKGVDWPIRIALSVGISIATVGLVSWLFNDLYTLDHGLFGVRPDRLVINIYVLTVVAAAGAIYRRSRLDRKEREKFVLPKVRLFENRKKDIIITGLLLMILIGAIVYGVYLWKFHHAASDRYTELYLLGQNGTIGNYPDIIEIEQYQTLYLGLVNHEFETRDYDIFVSLDNQGVQETVDSLDKIHLNRSVMYHYIATLDHDEKYQKAFSFLVDTQGKFLFSVAIRNDDGKIYREVKLELIVLDPENSVHSNGLLVYLADQFGHPADLPTVHRSEYVLPFRVVIVNENEESLLSNMTVYFGLPLGWIPIDPSIVVNLNGSNGLFDFQELPGLSRTVLGLNLILPKGDIELIIQMSNRDQLTLRRDIRVL